ncbi:restriction endonuclease subunit S [Paenalcaligenes faecalis]|uniref:restriction endonuclease subunit S n=1 Tax=Paenalcaligenes faecalis TaxID=2980099 RepID=UPI0022B9D20E|nr:restriction endonuclease subunit S [Paenalcaligenes faecalis]
MSQYSAYPRYVTTGCDWFPRIPEHWILDRAKWAVMSCQNGVWGSEPDGDDDLVCIRVADFDRQSLTISTTNLTMRSIPYKDRNTRLLKNGDLLIEKSGGGDQQLVGAVVEYNQDFPAVSSNFVARMEVNDNTDSRFIVYVHSHLYSGRVNYRSIKQTTGIQNLDSSAYLNEIIAYPPLDEQKSIARFLDHKTAQIDALIAKKQLLLDKLAEQRTALISQAVTKGLDPSVPMKDSGVEWLGEIPEHWEIWKVTHGFNQIGSGTTPKSDNPLFYDGDVPWVTTSELREGTIFDTSQKVTEEALAQYSALKLYPKGSLAIAMYGATIGRLGIFGVDATVNQACCVYSQPTVFDTRFIYYWLWMRRPVLISLSNGGGQPNLSQDDLKKLWIPIPDISEQKNIVQYLDKKVPQVDARITKVQTIIDKLNEYRAALITNAVTGKIDVRDFRLPTTTEQRELAHG